MSEDAAAATAVHEASAGSPDRESEKADACTARAPEDSGRTGSTNWGMAWFKLAIALVIAGQSGMWSLGYNNTPVTDRPPVGSLTYNMIHGGLIMSALFVIALLGPPLFRETWRNLRAGQITVEGLFVLSMIGAFAGSLISSLTGEMDIYYEIVPIVLAVYTVGKMIGARSREKALGAVQRLREDFDTAVIRCERGTEKRVPVGVLVPGRDHVIVRPGEPVPVDGILREGTGFVRETALTGEPAPVRRNRGDRMVAGSYSVDATLCIEPTAACGERQLDHILRTVESARGAPSELQEQADRIMQWFLPIVIVVSIGTFAVWTLLPAVPWWQALFNSMAVLLVACPCALGLATPIAVWGGMMHVARLGVVPRNGRFLDALAKASVAYFDKTGTLSEAELRLGRIEPYPGWEERKAWLLALAAAVEKNLPHPIARALQHEATENGERFSVHALTLHAGRGVEAQVSADGQAPEVMTVRIGTVDFAASNEASSEHDLPGDEARHVVLSIDGIPALCMDLHESLRPNLQQLFGELRDMGIVPEILTGDPRPRWRELYGVPVHKALTPSDKAARVERALHRGERVLFVGDGINDLGAMSGNVASLAMGGGAALARSVGDAVLMGDRLDVLPAAIALARRVRGHLHGNMLFAASYNAIGMTLAALGILHPIVAALLMVGSSALVSFRALRASRDRPPAGIHKGDTEKGVRGMDAGVYSAG